MAIPPHYVSIYQRPKEGTNFLRRYQAYNYQHTISNMGWFDTASCDVAVRSQAEGQYLINTCLGSFVSVYVDNPLQPIWEGLINRITYNSGKVSYTISLDDMANRLAVVYTGASNVAAQTALADYPGSQAIYGIKQDQIEFGVDPSAANQKTNLRDTVLSNRAFPQTSITQESGNANTVRFELIGVFHTLEWTKVFTALTTATLVASTNVGGSVAANANGSTFLNSTDTSQIQTNTMTIPNQDRATSTWERLKRIAASGDATNYWIVGVLPTNRSGNRLVYYRPANYGITYNARQAENLRIRDIYGKVVQPWLVQPDCVIRVTDALIGSNGAVQTDPTLTYIQNIQYDANSQQVNWAGDDDTTIRGVMKVRQSFKTTSTPFGAPLRTIAT